MLFALNQNGFITDINDIDVDQSYYCPACHEMLIAKTKGTKRRPHFAHKANSDCEHGYETALHLMAKELIEHSNSFFLPGIAFRRGAGRKDIVVEPQNVTFTRIETEQWLGDIVPDIIGYVTVKNQEIPIAIEILVTHKVDDEKLKKIIEKDLRTIEIDLSEYKENDLPKAQLKSIILGDSEKKYWLYNSKQEKKRKEYLEKGVIKTMHPVWDDYNAEYYQYMHNCPRKKFRYKGDFGKYCARCPHLVYLDQFGPYLCELP